MLRMLMHATAHSCSTNTAGGSALKVDPGRKVPCRCGELATALCLAFKMNKSICKVQNLGCRDCSKRIHAHTHTYTRWHAPAHTSTLTTHNLIYTQLGTGSKPRLTTDKDSSSVNVCVLHPGPAYLLSVPVASVKCRRHCKLLLMRSSPADHSGGSPSICNIHNSMQRLITTITCSIYTIHNSMQRLIITITCSIHTSFFGVPLCVQFSEATAEKMKSVYGVFCSKHTEAIQLYKEIAKTDRKFQNFCRVGPNETRVFVSVLSNKAVLMCLARSDALSW